MLHFLKWGCRRKRFPGKIPLKYDFIIIRLAPYSLGSSKFLLFFPLHYGTPFQYSCLENPMDGGAWCAAVHEVAKSRTWLSDFTFTFHFHALEKEMATCSSVLAWRIPGTAEPCGLPFMGSHRDRHDWSDLAAVAAKSLQTHWHFITHYWTLHWTPERRNPAPPTRTPKQASLTKKTWQATHTNPTTVRKLHNKENSMNCQNTERQPQTQQYKQDE